LRVLTVGNLYPPHHLGGYELVWQSGVRHLRAAGHEVRVLTSDFRLQDERDEQDEGVHRELRWYWRDHDFPRLSLRERLVLERANAKTMDRHLRELEPDLVSWWAMGGMSMASIERVRRTGISAAAVVCDEWMVYGPRVDGWMRAFGRPAALSAVVERLTGIQTTVELASVGPVLFPSEMLRSRTLDTWPALQDTEVCHQGIDRSLFTEAPALPWRGRLLYVGRIDPRKGIRLAIEALALLPEESSLVIAGRGDERSLAKLRQLGRDRGLEDRITFTYVAHEHLRELYAEADAVLFPVLWDEPYGLVPLEAMAVGTPVIATGRGGSAEYLRDGENAVLFDAEGGPPALAEAIRRLAASVDLVDQLRKGGLASVGRVSEQAFNAAVERLHERAASPHG
jgi:glycogen(starch) synthase